MFKRGQKVLFSKGAPYISKYDTVPHIAEVGKVGEHVINIKHNQHWKIGSGYELRHINQKIICAGGDNEMKSALGAAVDAHEEMMKTIKEACDKYTARIDELKSIYGDK